MNFNKVKILKCLTDKGIAYIDESDIKIEEGNKAYYLYQSFPMNFNTKGNTAEDRLSEFIEKDSHNRNDTVFGVAQGPYKMRFMQFILTEKDGSVNWKLSKDF